jgi:hypothetical protein
MIVANATVFRPYYEINGRKYIDLQFQNKIQKVKVPWRYGRVMCKTHGITPIQDVCMGQNIEVTLQQRVWDGETHFILESFEVE